MKRSPLLRYSTLRRRTALRSHTTLERRSRLNPRSAKAKAIAPQRRELVARLLAEYPVCQVHGCTCASSSVHELLSRARGGDILDESNCLAVCIGPGTCDHAHSIHAHPAASLAEGLLHPSWGNS